MGTYVPYTSKIWVGEKGLDFSPEIARSGCHKLMQYNRVGCLGLSYREDMPSCLSSHLGIHDLRKIYPPQTGNQIIGTKTRLPKYSSVDSDK